MKRWLTALVLGAFAPCHAQRPLSGEWALDKSRSQLSGRMRANAPAITQTLRIAADTASVCIVTITNGGPLGDNETVDRIAIDTLARPFQPIERVDSRASDGLRSARWRAEALQLVVMETITREIGGQRLMANNTHTWTLSKNTDTLVAITNTQGPRGSIPTHREFIRVKGTRPDVKPAACASRS
jgi:hypothetical protein